MNPKLIILFTFLFATICQAQQIEPDSFHIKGRNIEYFDSGATAKDKAIGGNIFFGKGFMGGNLSDYFSDPYFVGINLDLHRKKFIIQFDDYIGFGKVTESLIFQDQKEWTKNKKAFHFQIGVNLGYHLIDTRNFKLVPIAGIGGNILSSTFFGTSDNSDNEPFLPYCKVGFFIDFKSLSLLQKQIRINDSDHNYTSLRLSTGFNLPFGNLENPEFYKGSLFYITLGMGGLSRDFLFSK